MCFPVSLFSKFFCEKRTFTVEKMFILKLKILTVNELVQIYS
jgi:hypothetical protein